MSKKVLIAAMALTTVSTFVCAEQGDNYVPPNYSPYQSQQYQMPQSREELTTPYSPLTPNVELPLQRRPYAVLPPSNSYGYYGSSPYQRGGYPYYGNQSGSGMAMPWGGPGTTMPFGGSPFGGSPWGGSPWGNSFNWMGTPGMMPFGW